MRLLRYIFGLLIVLLLLTADSLICSTMFSRWFYLLIGASFFALLRLMLGRSNPDRLLSFKALSFAIIGFCAILAVSQRRDIYIDIAIAWILQSYLVTIFLAKYLDGEKIDD